MTARRAPIVTKPVFAPARSWPPTCPACGWTGEPNAEQTPYVACGGKKARHQRQPTGVRTRAVPDHETETAAAPAVPAATAGPETTRPTAAAPLRKAGAR